VGLHAKAPVVRTEHVLSGGLGSWAHRDLGAETLGRILSPNRYARVRNSSKWSSFVPTACPHERETVRSMGDHGELPVGFDCLVYLALLVNVAG
jgi:hypothetical protein